MNEAYSPQFLETEELVNPEGVPKSEFAQALESAQIPQSSERRFKYSRPMLFLMSMVVFATFSMSSARAESFENHPDLGPAIASGIGAEYYYQPPVPHQMNPDATSSAFEDTGIGGAPPVETDFTLGPALSDGLGAEVRYQVLESEQALEVLDLETLGWELPFSVNEGRPVYVTQGPTHFTEDGLACDIHTTHIGLDTNAYDISLHLDHPIQATADGEVAFVGWMGTYGNTVFVRHPESGLMSQYSHLNAIDEAVVVGAEIKKGQQLGGAGNSGDTYGSRRLYHLHFAVLPNIEINPDDLVDEQRYQQVGESVAINYPTLISWYGDGVLGSCSTDRYEAEFTDTISQE